MSAEPRQFGEKPHRSFLNFYGFLEDHPEFTYKVRAFTEDGFKVKRAAVRDHLDTADWVLDIACGGGILNNVINPARYVGIDRSVSVIRRAHRLGAGKFLVMDGVKLGFPDASFGSCITMDMFHHMRAEWMEPLFKEIRRVLKPGGRLLVTDPVKKTLREDPLSWCMQRLDRGDCFRTPAELEPLLTAFFKLEKHYTAPARLGGDWQIYILTR